MKTYMSGLAAMTFGLLACGSGSPSFTEAFDAGASCAELFEIRDSVNPRSPEMATMNDQLGSVGCLSRDAEREPARQDGSVYAVHYQASHMRCASDPREAYRQAGTSDPEHAAAWIAEGTAQGEAYEGSYEGCLDALTGTPDRFAPWPKLTH